MTPGTSEPLSDLLRPLLKNGEAILEKMNVTWREDCELARFELASDYCGESVERWFILCGDNTHEIKVTDQDKRAITTDFNPFATMNTDVLETKENDNPHKIMRTCALDHLEELIIV